jgi:hypothetical protein
VHKLVLLDSGVAVAMIRHLQINRFQAHVLTPSPFDPALRH